MRRLMPRSPMRSRPPRRSRWPPDWPSRPVATGKAGLNHSRSRIGMDADAMIVPSTAAACRARTRATEGSLSSVGERALDGGLGRRLVRPPRRQPFGIGRDGRSERGVDPHIAVRRDGTRSPRQTGRSTATTGRRRRRARHPPPRSTRTRSRPWKATGRPAGPRCRAAGAACARWHRPRRWSRAGGTPIGGRPGPATRDAAPSRSSRPGSLVASGAGDEQARAHREGRRHRGRRALDGTGPADGPDRAGKGPAGPISGSRKARFRCTGPGPDGPSRASATARAASGRHDAAWDPSGTPGSQAHRVEVVNSPTWSMVCDAPDMMQLGRAVGRADDEGHPALMGLDHRRMQLGGGRAARDADDGGRAAGHGEAEGEEAGAALIEADVHPQPGGQRQGQRRRARAGADHRIGDAAA